MSLEYANYYNDLRVRNGGNNRVPVLEDEDGTKTELPWKWEICPTCDGRGKHVNPSIDSGGLTSRDFYEDPDFRDEYMSGRYDVTCYQCGGRSSVPAVDLDRLTPEQRDRLEARERDDAEYHAMRLAEIRAGA